MSAALRSSGSRVRARRPHSISSVALESALVAAGVVFISENGGGAGVRLREPAKREDG